MCMKDSYLAMWKAPGLSLLLPEGSARLAVRSAPRTESCVTPPETFLPAALFQHSFYLCIWRDQAAVLQEYTGQGAW